MSYDQTIAQIDKDTVIAECGPMRLGIRAWNKAKARVDLAEKAAEKSFSYLERIAKLRSRLSLLPGKIERQPDDILARQMINSVIAIGDNDLTPMAAVAGTIADAVADWLFERDVTKVIVDNGGDISIRLLDKETVSVGIRPDVTSPEISHVVCLDAGRSAHGVTTSGVGGRSLTRGIASAVTVLAATASMADAASTAIANACFVEDDRIMQLPVDKIDPHSDLAGIDVTVEVESLGPEKTSMAIENAREKADYLTQKSVIIGAFIALGSQFVITRGMRPFISKVDENAG